MRAGCSVVPLHCMYRDVNFLVLLSYSVPLRSTTRYCRYRSSATSSRCWHLAKRASNRQPKWFCLIAFNEVEPHPQNTATQTQTQTNEQCCIPLVKRKGSVFCSERARVHSKTSCHLVTATASSAEQHAVSSLLEAMTTVSSLVGLVSRVLFNTTPATLFRVVPLCGLQLRDGSHQGFVNTPLLYLHSLLSFTLLLLLFFFDTCMHSSVQCLCRLNRYDGHLDSGAAARPLMALGGRHIPEQCHEATATPRAPRRGCRGRDA